MDGIQVPLHVNKNLRITTTIRKLSGQTVMLPDDVRLIPEDNIVKHTVTPDSDDEFIKITVIILFYSLCLKYNKMCFYCGSLPQTFNVAQNLSFSLKESFGF